MNLVVAALFTLNIHSLEGAIITAVAHGLSSSGLFILTGLIHDRIHIYISMCFNYVFYQIN